MNNTPHPDRRRALQGCIALGLAPWAGQASSQAMAAWPSKPVKLLVPYAAGGPADVVARELAQRLGQDIKQTVVVENQGGGMGLPSLTAVARAEPDGHTLWMPALGNVVLQPLLSKNGGAEQLARLRPVTMVSTAAHVLVVSAKLPVKTVKELVDYARANPGKVSFASAGTGGTAHLGMEMFKALSKTDVLHVPYKGSSGAVNDLASGQVSAMFSSLPSLQGIADKGLVRVLAATSASTSPATRALPLMSATLPGFDYTTWYALYAPQATPAAVALQINAAVRKALAGPALAAKIEPHGVELLGSAPEEGRCGCSAIPRSGAASCARRPSQWTDLTSINAQAGLHTVQVTRPGSQCMGDVANCTRMLTASAHCHQFCAQGDDL